MRRLEVAGDGERGGGSWGAGGDTGERLVRKHRCGPGLEPHEQAYGQQLEPEP